MPNELLRLETVGATEFVRPSDMIQSDRHRSTTTAVLRDVVTSASRSGSGVLQGEIYSCQLHNGEGSLEANTNAFLLTSGELYVRSELQIVAAAMLLANQMPIVVKKSAIQAGSLGTHWWVQACDESGVPILRFALLAPPAGAPGKIWIEDLNNTSAPILYVDQIDSFIEIRNGGIPSPNPPSQQPLANNARVAGLVEQARVRATWANLR